MQSSRGFAQAMGSPMRHKGSCHFSHKILRGSSARGVATRRQQTGGSQPATKRMVAAGRLAWVGAWPFASISKCPRTSGSLTLMVTIVRQFSVCNFASKTYPRALPSLAIGSGRAIPRADRMIATAQPCINAMRTGFSRGMSRDDRFAISQLALTHDRSRRRESATWKSHSGNLRKLLQPRPPKHVPRVHVAMPLQHFWRVQSIPA